MLFAQQCQASFVAWNFKWYEYGIKTSIINEISPDKQLYPDLNGFEGWMDKKMIFNGLEAICFQNHFAVTISELKILFLGNSYFIGDNFEFEILRACKKADLR